MTAALRYEWMRIRTIRSTWWLTSLAVLMGTSMAFLMGWGFSQALATQEPMSPEDRAVLAPAIVGNFSGEGAPFFICYLLAMIGVFAWGHEYRHGMIRATLTALPSRTNAWIGKFLVVGAWVVAMTALTLLLSAIMGWLWLHDDGVSFATADVARTIAKACAYSLLFTWVAAAFTGLVRQQAAALVLMFLWPLAIENVITAIAHAVPGLEDIAPLTRFLPFNAAGQILNVRDVTGSVFGDPLSPWGGFVIFAAVTAAVMAFSLVLFRSRDA